MKLIPQNKCRIGIVMVDERPYHISVVNQFLDQISHGAQGVYTPCVYRVAAVSAEEITRCVENAIIRGEVDVILTIGRACTVYAREVVKRHNNFPLLFIGVLDPVGEGVVESLEKPGQNITGALFEEASTDGLASGIAVLYPSIKRILIPFLATSKSGRLTRQAAELKEKLTQVGMQVFLEPITQDYDKLMQLIGSYRTKADCFLLLDGCFSGVAQKPIAYIAWEECITQIGCSSSSISNGAAIAYSGDLNPIVAACYQQLETARRTQVSLGNLPVKTLPDNREFTVNIDAMRKIGWQVKDLKRICTTKGICIVRRWVAPPGNY